MYYFFSYITFRNNGNLYHFDQNEDKSELILEGDLEGKVANLQGEANNKVFSKGFIAIMDIEISPYGYLYILSSYHSGDDCDPSHPNCVKHDSSVYETLFRIYPIDQSIGDNIDNVTEI
jgi:hypothetical protein